ncbi:MAG: radical SAM protein [Candidatus Latescibacteria bacterium]|nr:radical SAM protein [Candidatus Latescibacterota bacterium]
MSGGLAIIEDGNRDEVQRILADPNSYRSDTEEKKRLWDSLLKGRFLIEMETDELAILKMRNRVGKFNTDSFGLIIMPTLQCNFRCIYCHESFPNISMKPEIEEGILRWVREKTRFIQNFHVDWFGGEPLLPFDVINRLGSQFKRIAEERGCEYSVSMSTNGYLLTEDKIKQLVSSGLR